MILDALDRLVVHPLWTLWTWLSSGPRGYAGMLRYLSTVRGDRDRLAEELDAANRRGHAADQRAYTLERHVDDLCIRILEATLDVGKIAQVDVEIPAGTPHAPHTYTRESVDRLLDTARNALGHADDLARWATYRRRLLRAGDPPHDEPATRATLESILRRIETILRTAAEESDRAVGHVHGLEIIDHATAHVLEILRDAPLRRLPDPDRLP